MIRPETSRPAGEEARYRGVRKRAWGKWVSEIRLPNSRERIWLGSYDTPEKAARAFDAAMFCLRGRRGRFNFPHDVPDIPRARSLTPPEIQAAAARFAHEVASTEVAAPSSAQLPLQGAEKCCGSRAGSPALSNSGFSSDEGLTADSVDGVDWSFLDLLDPVEPSSGGSGGAGCADFDIGFPAIDDFPGEFFPPPPSEPPTVDYDDGGLFFGSQQSFLWNF